MEAVFNNSADKTTLSALKEMKTSLLECESKVIQAKDNGGFLVRINSINDFMSLPEICTVDNKIFFKSKYFRQQERAGKTFAYAIYYDSLVSKRKYVRMQDVILKRDQLTSLL